MFTSVFCLAVISRGKRCMKLRLVSSVWSGISVELPDIILRMAVHHFCQVAVLLVHISSLFASHGCLSHIPFLKFHWQKNSFQYLMFSLIIDIFLQTVIYFHSNWGVYNNFRSFSPKIFTFVLDLKFWSSKKNYIWLTIYLKAWPFAAANYFPMPRTRSIPMPLLLPFVTYVPHFSSFFPKINFVSWSL